MRSALRAAIFATVATASLAAATAAVALPTFQVTSTRVLGHAGSLAIATQQSPDAYRTTVLAPTAYTLPNIRHVDQTIGTASVDVSTAAGPLVFRGLVTGVTTDAFGWDDCASFAGYRHMAVWLAEVRQTDGIARAEIPIYVDAAPGGRTELTWCASAAADMTVTGVSLSFAHVFVNPVVPGAYSWRALFDVNPSGGKETLGVESTSAVSVVRL